MDHDTVGVPAAARGDAEGSTGDAIEDPERVRSWVAALFRR